jgi:hypothetical protein
MFETVITVKSNWQNKADLFGQREAREIGAYPEKKSAINNELIRPLVMDAATTKPRYVTTSEGGRATSIERNTRENVQMYGIVWKGGFSGVTTKQWVNQLQHLGTIVHRHYVTAKTMMLSK